MSDGDALRMARLDVIAGARAVLGNDNEGRDVILSNTEDPRELARAALSFAAAALAVLPPGLRREQLDAWTAAALADDGARE